MRIIATPRDPGYSGWIAVGVTLFNRATAGGIRVLPVAVRWHYRLLFGLPAPGDLGRADQGIEGRSDTRDQAPHLSRRAGDRLKF